jgi:hypothetical protein
MSLFSILPPTLFSPVALPGESVYAKPPLRIFSE